jgi:hypothetical protein
MKLSVEGIGADGSPVSYGVTLKYDGRDYPITGSGTPGGADTVAQKHIDPYTVEATFNFFGRPLGFRSGRLPDVGIWSTTACFMPVLRHCSPACFHCFSVHPGA